MQVLWDGWFIQALGVPGNHTICALQRWRCCTISNPILQIPYPHPRPGEDLRQVSRNDLSMPYTVHTHQWCWQQYLTPAGWEEGDPPSSHGLAQTLPLSPAHAPVNTSDDNSQATGELCSFLLDDSFCQLPGGRASTLFSVPWGWRMGMRRPCLGGIPTSQANSFLPVEPYLRCRVALH